MGEKETKKVLMLSLGTGKSVDGKQQAYDPTTYKLPDSGDGDKGGREFYSQFVAKPLVNDFEPDEIMVIGTARSQWEAFYDTFGDKGVQDTGVLCMEGGRGLATEELKRRSEEVEKIYNRGIRYDMLIEGKGADKKPHFTVVMTHYGVDDRELSENYRLLKDKLDSVLCEKGVKYDVAFDITHSFRSMPIYNLVILNYLKNVTRVEVDITDVYYGNFEVRKETDDKALIVDLNKIIDVMNLSNCVSEFKNTGNAASLRENISNDRKNLKDALKRFDMATQTNSYGDVMDSLDKLIRCCCKESKEESEAGEYASLCDMILDVICEKFFRRDAPKEGKEDEMLGWLAGMARYEKQYRLANWYYQQNRYGEAIATGLEALKSCLVPFYMEWKGKKAQDENENERKTAEFVMIPKKARRIKKNLKGEKLRGLAEAVEELFVSKSSVREKYIDNKTDKGEYFSVKRQATEARNVFAHNLGNDCLDDSMGLDELEESVKDFFKKFGSFWTEFQKCREDFGRAYMGEIRGNLIVAPKEKTYRSGDYGYENLEDGKRSKVIVAELDDGIREYLAKKDPAEASVFLKEYLEEKGWNSANKAVVLIGVNDPWKRVYVRELKSIGIKKIYDGQMTEISGQTGSAAGTACRNRNMGDEADELKKRPLKFEDDDPEFSHKNNTNRR